MIVSVLIQEPLEAIKTDEIVSDCDSKQITLESKNLKVKLIIKMETRLMDKRRKERNKTRIPTYLRERNH